MIYKISSKQNAKIKDVVKLSEQKNSLEKNIFKIEGFHLLEMGIGSNLVEEVFTTKELKEIPSNINQYIVTNEIMEKISSSKSPQGVVAICKRINSNEKFGDKILYLDNVSDPGNLGTILRTALAFGYKDILLSEGCVSQYNEKAIQASQGAIFYLNIVKNLDLSKLKGYKMYVTEIKGSISLAKVEKCKKHVLVLGNEAHGVSEKILKLADYRIRIDIDDIESLNVAVAGAIAMYELSK